MEEITDIKSYAIILIYPDGSIEKIKIKNNLTFHMEYILELRKESKKLNEIINRHNIYIPDDYKEARLMLTYELDDKLAEEGIIVLHNLYLDEEIRDEVSENADYLITMPSELTDTQIKILQSIDNECDLSTSWFANIQDGSLVDISYSDVKLMLETKTK